MQKGLSSFTMTTSDIKNFDGQEKSKVDDWSIACYATFNRLGREGYYIDCD